MMRIRSKSLTTTIQMLNATYLGRGEALVRALDMCLAEVPDAEQVTITVKAFDKESESQ